ncbi:MAG TPA: single-stranded-DNA-specific exonuclease RecJ [Anaerolineales bacterium]|jgi:single-stranded-DNA-specific exonuclease
MTRWLDPSSVEIPASFADLNLLPLIARTLVRRGLHDPSSARAYLDPKSYTPAAASELPGMADAVERVTLAIRTREEICVWGDFDVDGQTATTLLVQALRALGAHVSYYIPIRGKESHGVHIESLAPILDRGVRLILTCDTGITAHEPVEYARARGADVVITDHHDLGDTLPIAAAIINPKLLPADHPLATLAGVGVAFKLSEALLIDNHKSEIENLLDLVALGLIADLAILKHDARYLVQRGLDVLRNTQRLGLQTLFEFANLQPSTLNESSVGFALGPRLNALGRLGDANPAVELLTTQDPVRARILAAQIEGLNAQRKLLTDQVTQAAEAQLRADPGLLAQPAIVLGHAAWPGGVVGIVANRLVDRYHKPALLFNLGEDGIARGSARSIDGLHITQAIAAQKQMLRNFGGHPMAAGLALDEERLPEFRKALGRTVEKKLSEANIEEAVLEVDAWLTLDELSSELADSIERLAPFGPGNPPLLLATRGLQVTRSTEIGKNKEHLRLSVQDGAGREQDILWWQTAGELPPEGRFDLAYTLRAGTFRGARQLNVELLEFRVTEEKPVEIRKAGIEILDLRQDVSTLKRLDVEMLIWAEGADQAQGTDRFHLKQADELAIWTTPPSPAELRAALELVQPRRVRLYGRSPVEEKTDAFLKRLAGLTKYAISRRSGNATLEELIAATAQREASVSLGLEWLRAGGHIVFDGQQSLNIHAGDGIANQYAQKELFIALRGLLEESAAYRRHFATAPAEALMAP